MAKNLASFREEINYINYKILDLIKCHISLLNEINHKKDSLECFDSICEQEMLEYLFNQNKGPLSNHQIKEIFAPIFGISLQQKDNKKETNLLINSVNKHGFLTINQIFNLIPGEPVIIAGPCAIENIEYLELIAILLKQKGVKFLRGGAFKPRTSPYDFQGLREEGLKILHYIGKKYDLITVAEVVDTRDLDTVAEFVDVFQIGARNMQNYELLKEVGQIDKPVLLKRGLSATLQEFMFAAEYIGLQGNRKIILCERGIRTFETKTRNTLDIAAIPIIKKETCLSIIIDLSHSLGRKDIINSIANAAIAAGSDGLMVEVHPFPELALSDSMQQLNPDEFNSLLESIH